LRLRRKNQVKKEGEMVKAYVFIDIGMKADAGRIVKEIRKIDGVLESDAIAGPHDIITTIKGPSLDDVGRLVVSKVRKLKGVKRTFTCCVVKV
jgi:DNA-binding Lrp family transcriptional regulator